MNDENKTIGDLLKSIDDKAVDRAEVLPLLKGLERNTAGNTGKVIGKVIGTAITKAIANRQAGIPTDSTSPPVASAVATSATIPSKRASNAVASTTTPAATVRDASGKFHGKETTSEATPGASDPKDIGMTGALKNMFNKHKDGLKDTAGRMALGPLYDVAVEMKDSAKEAKERADDKTTVTGQVVKKTKGLFGFGKDKAQIAHDKAQAKHDKVEVASDKAEAKHDQLQAKADKAKQGAKMGTATGTAVMGAGAGESGGGFLDKVMAGKSLKDMWKNRKGVTGVTKGGGMLARGAGVIRSGVGTAAKLGGSAIGAISNLAGPIMSGISLPLVAAAGAAAFGIAQFGKALITGKSDVSDFMDWLTKKATGDKNATLSGKTYDAVQGVKNTLGFGPGGSVRDVIGQVESGNKGYGAYQNKDSGIVSYGKYQFTADSGSLGTVLDKYSANGGKDAEKAKQYSSIIKNGSKQQKEALRNDPQFKSMLDGAKSEKAMADAQEQTFDQNYYNPAMARGSKAGINVVKNQKVAGFLADTEIQAGSGGNQSVIGKAKAKLAQQGLDFKTATEDQQMQALVDSRKEYTLSVADAKARKGDTSTAAMLRSSASSGGRIDQVASTLKNTKIDTSLGYQTAAAAKAGASSIETQPGYTAKPGTREYNEMQAKFVADTQAAPVQVASATGTTSQKKKGGEGKKKEAAPVVAKEEPKPVKDVTPDDQAGTEIKTAVAEPASAVGTPERKAKKSSELRAEREAASVVSTVSASAPATAVQVATATQPLNATVPPAPAATTGTAQTAKKKTGFFDSLSDTATGFATGFAPNLAKSISLSAPAATVAGKVQTPTTGTATGTAVQAQPETVRLAKRSSQGVQTLSPLPQPQVAQVPLPPPVEVPGLERLAKSQEQQAVKKPDVVASAGLPNIKTEFDDTMLVLMSYDRI